MNGTASLKNAHLYSLQQQPQQEFPRSITENFARSLSISQAERSNPKVLTDEQCISMVDPHKPNLYFLETQAPQSKYNRQHSLYYTRVFAFVCLAKLNFLQL